MFAAHFLQVVIDDHITPLLGQSNPNFSGLLAAIIQMANYLFNWDHCWFDLQLYDGQNQ